MLRRLRRCCSRQTVPLRRNSLTQCPLPQHPPHLGADVPQPVHVQQRAIAQQAFEGGLGALLSDGALGVRQQLRKQRLYRGHIPRACGRVGTELGVERREKLMRPLEVSTRRRRGWGRVAPHEHRLHRLRLRRSHGAHTGGHPPCSSHVTTALVLSLCSMPRSVTDTRKRSLLWRHRPLRREVRGGVAPASRASLALTSVALVALASFTSLALASLASMVSGAGSPVAAAFATAVS
jgi:hypothetical protein